MSKHTERERLGREDAIREKLQTAICRSCIGADNKNYVLHGLSIADGEELLAEFSALRASQALLEAAWLDAKDLANERQLRVMDLEAAMARLDARINEVTQAWRTEQAEANDLAKEVIRLLEQIRRIEERERLT